jgi:hypothetical protein
MSTSQYQNDPSISDGVELWRRVPGDPAHIIFDGNLGRLRPTSAAFDDDNDGSPMSVIISEVVLHSGRAAESVLIGHEGYALASITARFARSCGQAIVRDPLPEEEAHGLVCGKKTKSIRSRLAIAASWVIPPPGATSDPTSRT